MESRSEGSEYGKGGYNKYLKVFIPQVQGDPDTHTVGVGKGLTMIWRFTYTKQIFQTRTHSALALKHNSLQFSKLADAYCTS